MDVGERERGGGGAGEGRAEEDGWPLLCSGSEGMRGATILEREGFGESGLWSRGQLGSL